MKDVHIYTFGKLNVPLVRTSIIALQFRWRDLSVQACTKLLFAVAARTFFTRVCVYL